MRFPCGYVEGSNNGVMGYSLRTERHRYTEWRASSTGEVRASELYEHAADPGESANIAGRPEHAATVKTLAAQLVQQFPIAALPKK